MNHLIVVLLVPFFTALVTALLSSKPRWQKIISLVSSLGLTAYVFWLMAYVDKHGVQTALLAGYSAPYGIAFVADRLSCIMLCLSMSIGTVALAYTFWTSTELQQKYFFYPLFQIVLLGVNWAFITGDLFNLFVAYEVMLIGSYGMMMVGASKVQVRQTMKYIAINIVGGSLFVVGIGLIYACCGTLNMADLAERTHALTGTRASIVTAATMVLIVVFALKSASFPFFFWLPDAYPVVPSGISGYFAGLLTKVGVYSLLRVFVMVFRQDGHELALNILLVMSGFTMLLGVLGAMCQWDIRRILSWHIISQVGYMVMGIGLAGNATIAKLAVAGTIFYVVHHIVVKSCLFLCGGIAERVSGSQKLKQMGGVYDLAPGVAGLFLVAALSLAGMPPFSGFMSKFVLIRAGVDGGNFFIVFIAVITSFFTLYSMTKIWSYAFWGEKRREKAGPNYRGMMIPTGVLVAFTIILGLWAQPFLRIASDAADDLTDPTEYIHAVMSARPVQNHSDHGHGEHADTTTRTIPLAASILDADTGITDRNSP